MNQSLVFLTHVALALLLAPLLSGVINRTKAIVAGRHGKPLLQLYFDLAKLLHKSEVISTSTSWVFTLAPSITLAATLLALLLLPLGGLVSPLAFQGDFMVAAYLLAMGRFAMILAALDTGSAFEGMGASREAHFSALAEPVLFVCFLAIISATGSFSGSQDIPDLSLSAMFGGRPASEWIVERAELLFIPLVLFVLLLVENCRIPVDDPNTHLELTMIHEVMILDHSGVNLAFIQYGAALKLWFFASLLAGILVPSGSFWLQTLSTLATIFGIAVLVGLVESTMARLRLIHIPALLGGAGALAALALILTQVR